jgi:hypothetical protein
VNFNTPEGQAFKARHTRVYTFEGRLSTVTPSFLDFPLAMPCTPSKSARRVLQDVAVNVSGTPSKFHRSSPAKSGIKAAVPIEDQENEGRLRGSFIGRKRTISEVDGAVSTADIARPVIGEHMATRGNQTLVCEEMTNFVNGDESVVSLYCYGEP